VSAIIVVMDTTAIIGSILGTTGNLLIDQVSFKGDIKDMDLSLDTKDIEEIMNMDLSNVSIEELYASLTQHKTSEPQKGHGVDYRKAWKQIEDAAKYVSEHCPNCRRDALPFVRFWQDLIRVKKGQPTRDPKNFEYWVETIKGIEIKDNEVVVPEHLRQKHCSACEQRKERLLEALNELEERTKDIKAKLQQQKT
jgi:hypothetical protein